MGSGTSRSVAPFSQPEETETADLNYIKELELKVNALEGNVRATTAELDLKNSAIQELRNNLKEGSTKISNLQKKLKTLEDKRHGSGVLPYPSGRSGSEFSIDSSHVSITSRYQNRSFGGSFKGRGDVLNRQPSKIGQALKQYKRRNVDNTIQTTNSNVSPDDSDMVYLLPRGGVYVWTKAGPVQFGMPPETLKDSMNLGLEVPTIFVVPRERFNMQTGVNVSELEFPAFFNFFVRQKRVTLITYPECQDDLRTIMKEALDGPDQDQIYIDSEYSKFASDELLAAKPDHVKEIEYFREPRPGVPTIEVDNLISFEYFDSMGICNLSNDVAIRDEDYGYTILQDNEVYAVISDDDTKSCFFPEQPRTVTAEEENKEDKNTDIFTIPKFGLTILGSSHGFDPKGWTSGFVVWINGQGVMVDPPPHSTEMLKQSGIQPKAITATILTHCHADHDAGTIQKMITEGKVTLMTTQTVFSSLLRKYSGVSGLAPEFLNQLVNFRPVFLEEPTYWGGACFRFFYSLHAIPCVGFEVSFGGKRIVYSADTFYEPDQLKAMCERGILSPGRRDALINFPWDCDIVLHEAGVPPIHTPISAFEKLPPEHQKNIQLIHIGGKEAKAATEKGFRICKPGVENTIILIEASQSSDYVSKLQLISSVDIFRGFEITKALELLFMSEQCDYKEGEIIAKKGTSGDKFIIIMSGCASVTFSRTKKFFRVGDYLGEISVITNDTRTATIEAETDVRTIEIDKYAFNHFLKVDNLLYNRMQNLVKARMDGSWQAIAQNSVLRNLTAAQKTSLQAMFIRKDVEMNETIWEKGGKVSNALLVFSGEFLFDEVHNMDPYEFLTQTKNKKQGVRRNREHLDSSPFDNLQTGAFICDMYALSNDVPLTVTLRCCSENATVFLAEKTQILSFLDNNPIVLLALIKNIVIL